MRIFLGPRGLLPAITLALAACGASGEIAVGPALRTSSTTTTVTTTVTVTAGATSTPAAGLAVSALPPLTTDDTILVTSGVSADGPWSFHVALDFRKVVLVVAGRVGGEQGGDPHTPCPSSAHPVALLFGERADTDSYTVGIVDPAARFVRLERVSGAVTTPVLHLPQFSSSALFAVVTPGEIPDLQGLTAVYPDGHAVTVDLADKQYVWTC